MVIRKAVPGDEIGIAHTHINTWREAYRTLLPQDFLDQLPLSLDRRIGWWKGYISEPEKYVLYVAESSNAIIGFTYFQPAREAAFQGYAELTAIYLLEKFKGQGIGAEMLKLGMHELRTRGYTQVYCWVLENNPTIAFYERSGAVLHAMEKIEKIGGKEVKELLYEWKSLDHFK